MDPNPDRDTGYPPPPERRCTATSKQRGKRCRRWSRPGLSVCYFHGGATRTAREAGERRLALQKALAQAEAERQARRDLITETFGSYGAYRQAVEQERERRFEEMLDRVLGPESRGG